MEVPPPPYTYTHNHLIQYTPCLVYVSLSLNIVFHCMRFWDVWQDCHSIGNTSQQTIDSLNYLCVEKYISVLLNVPTNTVVYQFEL